MLASEWGAFVLARLTAQRGRWCSNISGRPSFKTMEIFDIAKKVALMLALYCVFFAAEHVRPARKPDASAFLSNCATGTFFLVASPLIAYLPLAAVAAILASMGAPLFRIDLSAIPLLSVIATFFVFDFFYYWFHRLQHTTFLWEEHKIHHSDENLSASTNYRHHWLEDSLRAFLLVLPMGIFFKFSVAETTLIGFAIGQWAYFIHMNVRLPLGPLSGIVVGPQLHRIHHSIEPHHRDRNFGAFFPIWDVIFGTYYRPAPGEYPPTGVAGERTALTWREVILGPFPAWWSMLKERRIRQAH